MLSTRSEARRHHGFQRQSIGRRLQAYVLFLDARFVSAYIRPTSSYEVAADVERNFSRN